MTDPAPVLRHQMDDLIHMQITTLNSARPPALRGEPVHGCKIICLWI
jgi:hypothetical protein